MSELDALRNMALFVEVARRKSFSGAAVALGLPLSSLSRRIAGFEAMIGARLINRTTRRIELTTQGESYLRHCQQIVEQARIAYQEVVSEVRGLSGLLKVHAPSDLAGFSFGPIISGFARLHPHIKVHVDLSAEAFASSDPEADLFLRLGEPKASSPLIAHRIAAVPFGLYVSPRYLRSAKPLTEPTQLAQHSCLLVHSEAEKSHWSMTRDDKTISVAVTGTLSSSNLVMIKNLAVNGAGIVQLPHFLVAQEMVSGQLTQVLSEWSLATVPLYALTTSRMLPTKTRSFIAYVSEHLRALLVPRHGDRALSARPTIADARTPLERSALTS